MSKGFDWFWLSFFWGGSGFSRDLDLVLLDLASVVWKKWWMPSLIESDDRALYSGRRRGSHRRRDTLQINCRYHLRRQWSSRPWLYSVERFITENRVVKKNRMVRSSNAFGFHVFLLFRVSFRFFFSHIYGRWIPLGLRWWCHRHQKKRTLWKKTEFLDKNISSSFWQIVHWSQPFSEARRRSIR